MKRKKNEDIEARIRDRVEKKFQERGELIQHFTSYFAINIMLWIIWLVTGRSFPWPLFVTLFWGIGMLSHFASYYNQHGRGARKREAQIEAEVARELSLARAQAELENWRADGGQEEHEEHEEYEETAVYKLDQFEGRGLRLSDDGELAYLGSEEEDGSARQSQR